MKVIYGVGKRTVCSNFLRRPRKPNALPPCSPDEVSTDARSDLPSTMRTKSIDGSSPTYNMNITTLKFWITTLTSKALSRNSAPDIFQNGARSSWMASKSSTSFTSCSCANCHHSPNPLGGSRPYRLLYSITASSSVLLCPESLFRNVSSASAMSFDIGCSEYDTCLGERSRFGDLENQRGLETRSEVRFSSL
jgi:hypothetical protein